MNTLFSWVAMLIFVRPARTAAARSSSGTPDEPCSTSGTPAAWRSLAIRPRSRTASLVSMACELPTATASASTPVDATKPAAWSGSVRATGECTPSLPPTSPSSASTQTPRSWHHAATSAVARTLSAYGSWDASYMTDPRPNADAARTSSARDAWSRCTATGTAAERATARQARAIGSSAPCQAAQFSLICSTTGASAASAPVAIASACSMPMTLNAPTPRPAARAGPMISPMVARGISGPPRP